MRNDVKVVITKNELETVKTFFSSHSDFRTLDACSKETGLDILKCKVIKSYLYKKRRLGAYYFEKKKPPQKYMRKYILDRFIFIDRESIIVEIGPGNSPIFPPMEYPNWYGIDKYYDGNLIDFRGKKWGENRYPEGRIFNGTWEKLGDILCDVDIMGKCDLLVASHSFEHVFQPIQSLIEASKLLRSGGCLSLFVPDGRSDDPAIRLEPTHTLYITPDMMEEFFFYSGVYQDISIECFRPNFDLAVTAIKI